MYLIRWTCLQYESSRYSYGETNSGRFSEAERILSDWSIYPHIDRIEIFESNLLIATYEKDKETLKWKDLTFPKKIIPKEPFTGKSVLEI